MEFERIQDEPQAAGCAARECTLGARVYPDATFTLRLNYGTVQGWVKSGAPVESFTRLGRAVERATGSLPFKIPDSWMKVKDRFDMNTRFCISTSSDIVGGNSGGNSDSPLV